MTPFKNNEVPANALESFMHERRLGLKDIPVGDLKGFDKGGEKNM